MVVGMLFLVGCESKPRPKLISSPSSKSGQESIKVKKIPTQISEIYLQRVETLEDLAGKGLFMPRLKVNKYNLENGLISVNRLDCWLSVPEESLNGHEAWRFENPKPNYFDEINYIYWHDNKN